MKRSIFLLAALLVSGSSVAQKPMYRCGNNYQDRPCDGAAPAAKTATASPSAPATAATPAAKPAAVPATSPAAKSATGPVADAQKAAPPLTKAQQQRQIRCENFGRQRDELRDRQKASPQQADAIGVQMRSLESRMSADGCT